MASTLSSSTAGDMDHAGGPLPEASARAAKPAESDDDIPTDRMEICGAEIPAADAPYGGAAAASASASSSSTADDTDGTTGAGGGGAEASTMARAVSSGDPEDDENTPSDRMQICGVEKPVTEPPCGSTAARCKENQGWRRIVRNFTPSWFSVNMGTGIVSILLYNLPYNARWVQYIAIAIFVLNIALFSAFLLISVARYTLYPEIWGVMIKHPAQSLFLGCMPMGLATIINMIVFVCASWGPWVIYLAWSLWWLDVIASCACGLMFPFIVVHHHRNKLATMNATLLLPIVPAIVASASGGVVAAVLPHPSHVVTTVVVSYVLWGLGQAFAFYIMTIYFLRLQIHDLPPREAIVSVFLPVGPLGQGGFAIQQLGKVALAVLPRTGAFNGDSIQGGSAGALDASAMYGGVVLYILGVVGALFMWGAALGWLAFALFSILTTKSFPFNMGWWGFTFPLGVFTTCTGLMATELSSGFLHVLTEIFSASVLLLWIMVSSKTLFLAVKGDIFYAPCLNDLPKDEVAEGKRTV
ncbi:flavodoxin and radical sam domain containing protein [Niveomyces insectorum RCEF 264]|uniref:Sulfite efflux pump SSU1 n=1 Tax=Niveomyces insectorum RCEF 264 TaxID=1081102 RepID=A0A168A8G5_9HYPO|nr:flavodoxin and radical sam domain containing protein [Niveomyces insectorum RCEF 264]